MSAKKTEGKAPIGSSFDDFLRETGDYETAQAVAAKRVLAWRQKGEKARSDAFDELARIGQEIER